MRAKMRVLVLVLSAILLAAPAAIVTAAPAAVDHGIDRAPQWSGVLSVDWVQNLLQAWFGIGGDDADVGTDASVDAADPGPTSLRATDGTDDGNGGPGWDPHG